MPRIDLIVYALEGVADDIRATHPYQAALLERLIENEVRTLTSRDILTARVHTRNEDPCSTLYSTSSEPQPEPMAAR